ncbi:hypothetical protein ACJJTC_005515 [Scirpophaga incertulas]
MTKLSDAHEPIYENVPLPWQNERGNTAMRDRAQSLTTTDEIARINERNNSHLTINKYGKQTLNVPNYVPIKIDNPDSHYVNAQIIKAEKLSLQDDETPYQSLSTRVSNNNTINNSENVTSISVESSAYRSAISDTTLNTTDESKNASVSSKEKKRRRWGVFMGRGVKGEKGEVRSATLGRDKARGTPQPPNKHRWSTGLPKFQPLPPSITKETLCQLLERRMSEEHISFAFERLPKGREKGGSVDTGLLPQHAALNGFSTDSLPYDDNRVRLRPTPQNPHGYINASHITMTVGSTQRFYVVIKVGNGPGSTVPSATGACATNVASTEGCGCGCSGVWECAWQVGARVIALVGDPRHPHYLPKDNTTVDYGKFQVSCRFRSVASWGSSARVRVRVGGRARHLWHVACRWPSPPPACVGECGAVGGEWGARGICGTWPAAGPPRRPPAWVSVGLWGESGARAASVARGLPLALPAARLQWGARGICGTWPAAGPPRRPPAWVSVGLWGRVGRARHLWHVACRWPSPPPACVGECGAVGGEWGARGICGTWPAAGPPRRPPAWVSVGLWGGEWGARGICGTWPAAGPPRRPPAWVSVGLWGESGARAASVARGLPLALPAARLRGVGRARHLWHVACRWPSPPPACVGECGAVGGEWGARGICGTWPAAGPPRRPPAWVSVGLWGRVGRARHLWHVACRWPSPPPACVGECGAVGGEWGARGICGTWPAAGPPRRPPAWVSVWLWGESGARAASVARGLPLALPAARLRGVGRARHLWHVACRWPSPPLGRARHLWHVACRWPSPPPACVGECGAVGGEWGARGICGTWPAAGPPRPPACVGECGAVGGEWGARGICGTWPAAGPPRRPPAWVSVGAVGESGARAASVARGLPLALPAARLRWVSVGLWGESGARAASVARGLPLALPAARLRGVGARAASVARGPAAGPPRRPPAWVSVGLWGGEWGARGICGTWPAAGPPRRPPAWVSVGLWGGEWGARGICGTWPAAGPPRRPPAVGECGAVGGEWGRARHLWHVACPLALPAAPPAWSGARAASVARGPAAGPPRRPPAWVSVGLWGESGARAASVARGLPLALPRRPPAWVSVGLWGESGARAASVARGLPLAPPRRPACVGECGGCGGESGARAASVARGLPLALPRRPPAWVSVGLWGGEWGARGICGTWPARWPSPPPACVGECGAVGGEWGARGICGTWPAAGPPRRPPAWVSVGLWGESGARAASVARGLPLGPPRRPPAWVSVGLWGGRVGRARHLWHVACRWPSPPPACVGECGAVGGRVGRARHLWHVACRWPSPPPACVEWGARAASVARGPAAGPPPPPACVGECGAVGESGGARGICGTWPAAGPPRRPPAWVSVGLWGESGARAASVGTWPAAGPPRRPPAWVSVGLWGESGARAASVARGLPLALPAARLRG